MEERERQQAEEKAKIDAEKERERQFIELLKQARSAAISPRAALPSRSDLALTRLNALTRPPGPVGSSFSRSSRCSFASNSPGLP